MSASRKKRIFLFCRFYLIPDFHANFDRLADQFDFHYFADGKWPGTRDTRARFYAAMKSGEVSADMSPDDVQEIIDRCRYSRNTDPNLAHRQVHAMAIAISEEMDSVEPDMIMTHLVDDYVTHICALLAEKRGIHYCAFAYSYFPDRAQLVADAYGTPYKVRQPDDHEAQSTLAMVSERAFRQNYQHAESYSWLHHIKMVLRHYVKRNVFKVKGIFERDPLNLHYRVTPYVGDRKSFCDMVPKEKFSHNWRADLEKFGSGSPAIYYPLAFFPESTVDYWIGNKRILKYDDCVIDQLRSLDGRFPILVKEHLHMCGIRKPAFYDRLNSIPGVILVPPSEFSNDLVEASSAIVVGGGSIGIEATVRGKPVFSFAPNCYWFKPSKAVELSLENLNDWGDQIAEHLAQWSELERPDPLVFIKSCLQSTVRMREIGRKWPIIEQDDLEILLRNAPI